MMHDDAGASRMTPATKSSGGDRLAAANAARAALKVERDLATAKRRAEHTRRWEAIAGAFDSVELAAPRKHQTLTATTSQRTLGDVLRPIAASLSISGYYALDIEDAEAIAKALTR
jgi:hypothetical protein